MVQSTSTDVPRGLAFKLTRVTVWLNVTMFRDDVLEVRVRVGNTLGYLEFFCSVRGSE